jgi:antitoxin component HigA of HigAB toxin-antitoxin module
MLQSARSDLLRIFYRRMTMTENEAKASTALPASVYEKMDAECVRLLDWMKLTGFGADDLAQYIGMRPNTLRVQLHRRRLTDSFRWRFMRAFPKGVAATLLLQPGDFPYDDEPQDEQRVLEVA